MRSLLSELARVSHSAQVTGRGGFQGHAGLKNRGARATGPRLGPPGPALGYLWGSERALPPGPGARQGHRAGPSPTLRGLADAPGLRAFGKAHRIPARLPGHAHGENGAPGTTVTQ